MEVTNTMGAAELLRKYLTEADPDLVRSMVQSFAEVLMNAEASGLCNAEYGQVTDDRVNSRNGYRHPALGHPGGHHRPGHPEAAQWQLLPGLAHRAPSPS